MTNITPRAVLEIRKNWPHYDFNDEPEMIKFRGQYFKNRITMVDYTDKKIILYVAPAMRSEFNGNTLHR